MTDHATNQAAHNMDTPQPPAPVWRKSSRSVPNGECVEVAVVGETVNVRNSRTIPGPTLSFPDHAWRQFLHALVRGDLA